MGSSKLNISRYKPNSILRKNGFVWRRFVFSGTESETGAERLFFVEAELLNPYLSPEEPVLGFKVRPRISEEDLQYALAGTEAAHAIQSESFVVPSYGAVRAGAFGTGSRQFAFYFPAKSIGNDLRLENFTAGSCSFSADHIVGEITYTSEDIREHPEYLCDSGSIKWDLRYEIQYTLPPVYRKKADAWLPSGTRTVFAGTVTLDGREYHVVPKSSCGYIELDCGRTMPAPWFHLSASNLTSLISGKTLFSSCFALSGSFEGTIGAAVRLEDDEVVIKADTGSHAVKPIWECTQMPEDEDGEKLHWAVSTDDKKWVIDIDIMCQTKQLSIRNIECPEGGRKVMKILCGGTGTGEIRLYRHVKKNLELIEDAHVANALCEYGQLELPEQ
jgi:tocopherol cyclase